MPKQPTPLRGSRRSALALLTLLAHLPAHAEETQAELEPLIVSALRVPQKACTVTSAVTVLDPKALQDRGILQLREALNESPGVISTSTGGQSGANGSIFIRGTTTQYAQVVMDGMRLSDSNNQLGRILAGARTHNVGGIEMLRGPQGAIYGGESIGGVLWMETPRGSGKPRGSSTLEAGSFHSLATSSLYQGETGDCSYYVAGGYEETDNDAPHNHYQQWDGALRVEGKINPVWTLGTTFRSNDSTGEDLDTSSSQDSESSSNSTLGTVYAIGKISDRWTARFHVGFYQESFDQDYTYLDSWSGLSFPSRYFSDLRAGNISTDHEITLADNLRLLVGAFAHKDTYESTYSPDQNGTRYGAHSTLEWDVIEHLTTSASLRWEDYDAYGRELTWRLGSIYTLPSTGTTLRGGIGTSFRSPTYMELFSPPPGGGNPDLSAASSLGWDLGFEQKIGKHHTMEVTWFQNQITDQIGLSPSYTYVNNPGVTDTNGLELGLHGAWLNNALNYRLAWTCLRESLQSAGMPDNAATASLDWKPDSKSLIGIGATYLSDHTWGGESIGAYTITRIYGSYQLSDKVKLHARLENIFNESYYLFNYTNIYWSSVVKGAGPGLYAGITVDW
jgi:outer membrane cobalamin receptor